MDDQDTTISGSENIQYTTAKTTEIPHSIGIALQDLDLVVAAFGKSVGVGCPKGIQNRPEPLKQCFFAVAEFRQSTAIA